MRKLLLATSALLSVSVGIAGVAKAGTLQPNAPNPAPGSITVTLNALVETFLYDATDTGTQRIANQKTADYGIGSYVRLYPSFDGVLANGLKYGASVELRQNSGINRGSSQQGDTGTMYVQRSFLYVGTDKFGKIEIGSPVQPSELFQTGNPANFNTGGWDGDLPGAIVSGVPYFIDDDADRANKIVYVSPQYAGFDFGISFEPNAYGRDFSGSGEAFARASSVSSSSAQFGSRRNTLDGAVRYTGSFGAIGLKANVAGSYGTTVKNSTADVDGIGNHKNFSFVGGGVAVTFGGLEVDGHIDTGKFGPDYSTLPAGGGSTTAYVVGASYTIGPVIFGASYYGFDSGYTKASSTAFNNVGALHGYGIAAGGTYTLAPGASVFLEYLYGHQHARGYDIVNGVNDNGANSNNNTRAQAFGIGTAFKW